MESLEEMMLTSRFMVVRLRRELERRPTARSVIKVFFVFLSLSRGGPCSSSSSSSSGMFGLDKLTIEGANLVEMIELGGIADISFSSFLSF